MQFCCDFHCSSDFVCAVVFTAVWTSFVLWLSLRFELRLWNGAFSLRFGLRSCCDFSLRFGLCSCCGFHCGLDFVVFAAVWTLFVLWFSLFFGLRLYWGFRCSSDFVCDVFCFFHCGLDFVRTVVFTAVWTSFVLWLSLRFGLHSFLL